MQLKDNESFQNWTEHFHIIDTAHGTSEGSR